MAHVLRAGFSTGIPENGDPRFLKRGFDMEAYNAEYFASENSETGDMLQNRSLTPEAQAAIVVNPDAHTKPAGLLYLEDIVELNMAELETAASYLADKAKQNNPKAEHEEAARLNLIKYTLSDQPPHMRRHLSIMMRSLAHLGIEESMFPLPIEILEDSVNIPLRAVL